MGWKQCTEVLVEPSLAGHLNAFSKNCKTIERVRIMKRYAAILLLGAMSWFAIAPTAIAQSNVSGWYANG